MHVQAVSAVRSIDTEELPPVNTDEIYTHLAEQGQRFQIHYIRTIDTTMNIATWASQRAIPCSIGLTLVAGEQTDGLGYKGRWFSVPHKDVMMTIVVPDVFSLRETRLVQFAAALSVCQALKDIMHECGILFSKFDRRSFVIKYPNDVYCEFQGSYRKICGSMCIGTSEEPWKSEKSAEIGIRFPKDVAILGVGVNIACSQPPEGYIGPPRVSFEEVVGKLLSRELVIGRILRHLAKNLGELKVDKDQFMETLVPFWSVTSTHEALVTFKDGDQERIDSVRFLEVMADGVRLKRNGLEELVPHHEILRMVEK